MARKMNRFDLIESAQRIRKAKEEVVKVAMLLGMDSSYEEAVNNIQPHINGLCETLDLIDNEIEKLDQIEFDEN